MSLVALPSLPCNHFLFDVEENDIIYLKKDTILSYIAIRIFSDPSIDL